MQITTEFYGKSEIWIYKFNTEKIKNIKAIVSNN